MVVFLVTFGLMNGIGHAAVTFYTSQATFNGLVSTTLLEDFESFTPKDTALPSFISNGVTYTGYDGVPYPNVWVASPGYINFGPGVGTTTTSILTANGNENFTAVFSTPYYAIGLDTYLNGLGPATASFYGKSGLIGSFIYPGTTDDKEYLGIISTEAITSFNWTGSLGGHLDTGIDNISVSSAPVPIPAAAWLLGSGLLGLIGARRKFIK